MSSYSKLQLFELYTKNVQQLPQDHQTVGGVLYSCVITLCDDIEENVPPVQNIYSSKRKLVSLETNGSQSIFQALTSTEIKIQLEEAILIADADDKYFSRYTRAATIASSLKNQVDLQQPKQKNRQTKVSGLCTFEKAAIARSQMVRLLRDESLPVRAELSSTERGIKETELLTFSKLSAVDLYRSNQLQECVEMMSHHAKDMPNFTGALKANGGEGGDGEGASILQRRYHRPLSAISFAQILSNELVREPNVVSKYYNLTDDMLYALHWPPPDRRNRFAAWEPDERVLALCGALRAAEVIGGKGNSKKSSKKAVAAPAVSAAVYHRFQIDTKTLTPAGDAIALIRKSFSSAYVSQPAASAEKSTKAAKVKSIPTVNTGSNGNVLNRSNGLWLSIYSAGCLLGLRVDMPYPDHDYNPKSDGGENIPDGAKNKLKLSRGGSLTNANDLLNIDSSLAESQSDDDASLAPSQSLSVEQQSQSGLQMEGENNNDGDENEAAVASMDSLAVAKGSCVSANGCFTCHTDDDVRFVVLAGPCPVVNKKPDKCGTVCFVASYSYGLQVSVCSNGDMKMENTTSHMLMKMKNDSQATAHHPAGKIHHKHHHHHHDPLAAGSVKLEKGRYIGKGAKVIRVLDVAGATVVEPMPYVRDTLHADGSRILERQYAQQPGGVPLQRHSAEKLSVFHQQLLDVKYAPALWKYIHLGVDGSVHYWCIHEPASGLMTPVGKGGSVGGLDDADADGNGETSANALLASANGSVHGGSVLGTPPTSKSNDGGGGDDGSLSEEDVRAALKLVAVPHPTLHMHICVTTVDAETKSIVKSFSDGRVMITRSSGSKEVFFGDGTRIVSHSRDAALVYIHHESYPQVEMDIEVDCNARGHAKGLEVPINKGGNRVRSRVALPDGTAVLIKYDTKITARTNGSLSVVRRDRSSFLALDNCVVTYSGREAWTAKQEKAFRADAVDGEPELAVTIAASSTNVHPAAAFTGQPHLQHQNSLVNSLSTAVAAESSAALGGKGKSAKNVRLTSTAGKGPISANESSTVVVASGAAAAASVIPAVAVGASIMKKDALNNSIGGSRTSSRSTKKGAAANISSIAEEGEDGVPVHESTKFVFNFALQTCTIQDYDHNCFDIDLLGGTGMDPKIQLSGEVEGLKPPAVAARPMEPRLFIVNRSAEAVEVLPDSAVKSLQELVDTISSLSVNHKNIGLGSGDAYSLRDAAFSAPADRGNTVSAKYFVRSRMLGGHADAFEFAEVFNNRAWHLNSDGAHPLPAAANFALRTAANLGFNMQRGEVLPASRAPRLFKCTHLLEFPVLNAEGYESLSADLARCEQFREFRAQSIDRFAVEETRSAEELEETAAMTKRLKLAYKAAKVNKAKKKDKKKASGGGSEAGGDDESKNGGSPGGPPLAGGKTPIATKHNLLKIEEAGSDAEDEDAEAENDEVAFGDEEVVIVLSPEEHEFQATFADFGHNVESDWDDGEKVIPLDEVRDAAVRIFNCYVSDQVVTQALVDCGCAPDDYVVVGGGGGGGGKSGKLARIGSMESEIGNGRDSVSFAGDVVGVNIDEFRAVIARIHALQAGGGESGVGDDTGDESSERRAASRMAIDAINPKHPLNSLLVRVGSDDALSIGSGDQQVATDRNEELSLASFNNEYDEDDELGRSSVSRPGTRDKEGSPVGSRGQGMFWKSPGGKAASHRMPTTAPPLDLRVLNWNTGQTAAGATGGEGGGLGGDEEEDDQNNKGALGFSNADAPLQGSGMRAAAKARKGSKQ